LKKKSLTDGLEVAEERLSKLNTTHELETTKKKLASVEKTLSDLIQQVAVLSINLETRCPSPNEVIKESYSE